MYGVELSNSAGKFLRKCHENVLGRITEKIEKLRINPYQPETIPIQGTEKQYRVRVGDYRIIYEIDHERQLVHIVKIDKRSRIY